MTGYEELILMGWLRLGAPRLTNHPDAPLSEILSEAISILSPAYGNDGVLKDALGNALRRSAAQALKDSQAFPDPVQCFQTQEKIMQETEAFRRILDNPQPLARSLCDALNSIEAITGLGESLLPGTVAAFSHHVREVLPRHGHLGLDPVVTLLEQWLSRLPAPVRIAAERDLGSAHSMLGHRQRAHQIFSEAGDHARALLEEADNALEEGNWSLGGALARLAVEAAEMTHNHALRSAALRRCSSTEEHFQDYRAASTSMRAARDAARQAGDHRAEVVAIEELSRLAADQGQVDRAVVLLGRIWRIQRERANVAGQGRALRLAGRLLAEGGHPGAGLIMLLEALDLAETHDPHVAHGLKQYIVGFQYTLNEAEFAKIEPLFDQDREMLIWQAFAAARCRDPAALE